MYDKGYPYIEVNEVFITVLGDAGFGIDNQMFILKGYWLLDPVARTEFVYRVKALFQWLIGETIKVELDFERSAEIKDEAESYAKDLIESARLQAEQRMRDKAFDFPFRYGVCGDLKDFVHIKPSSDCVQLPLFDEVPPWL